MVLEPNEEYLSINIEVGKALHLAHKAINEGKESINIAAFKNKERTSGESPNYKSNNVAVWIQHKKTHN